MAEFQEVMKQFERMCRHFQRKGDCPMGCPMNGVNISQCRKIAFEQPYVTEKTVMAWAAENPEMVYPTWIQYFNKIAMDNGRKPFLTDNELLYAINSTIPSDVAQKLGIEPKEDA